MTSLRERADAALRTAMRSRDRTATSAYRTLLSALANAEAVPSTARAGAIEEAGVLGGDQVEIRRRVLSDADVTAVARAEIEELLDEVRGARDRGDDVTAERLHQQAQLLEALLVA